MIEIGRHIEILLLSNDCVIVPELGGFMAHHVTARYDERDNMFLPPLRKLGFNSQLRLNDSLLAQSYVEAYDISYPEAQRRIEEEVNELKQHIANEGQYELNDIGILRLNDEGAYLFEPCEAGILTPELYGLSSFDMNTMSEYTGIDVESSPTLKEEQTVTETKEAEVQGTIEKSLEDSIEEEEKTIKIKVSWIRNIVATAAAVVAFFIMATPVSNSGKMPTGNGVQTANIISISTTEAIASPDTTKQSIKQLATQQADTTKVSASKTAVASIQTDTVSLDQKKGFCIVLASHVAKKGANDYVKELQANGYKDAYVYTHNKIVRVVYGNYGSEQEARDALQNVRSDKYFEQSWIYEKR